ncbi:MAG: nucleoside kinase [Bacillota bacterium]|nr:nucleoside kinase [Bacillota bacterium]
MKIADINEINRKANENAREFANECEKDYTGKLEEAARFIASRIKESPVVLISGPSASGKTTSAKRLELTLESFGINAHLISLDDYFKTRDERNSALDPKNKVDLESPDCLDIPLLNRHLKSLSRGEEILVPKFDFVRQARMDKATPLRLKKDEIAVIEGIHALNDAITGEIGGKATKMYVSVRTRIGQNDRVIIRPEWLRLIRRSVRDSNFRGAPAERTLSLWKSIRQGETRYIMPFKHSADIKLDTFLGYEACVLGPIVSGKFSKVPRGVFEEAQSEGILDVIDMFRPISCDMVPGDSILREFIGGSSISY